LVLAEAALLGLAFGLPAWLARELTETRVERAQREAEAIANALAQLQADVALLPGWRRVSAIGGSDEESAIEVLVGPGAIPKFATPDSPWATGRVDLLRHHLFENLPGYTVVRTATKRGWRGPYVSAFNADPWQNRYMVNVGAGRRASGRDDPSRYIVAVVSAGPNGIVETPYWLDRQKLSTVHARTDDIVVPVLPENRDSGRRRRDLKE
jgi:hypothetical protein